ncbi:MAG: hypothetical protein LAO22_00800 [Acidobacteriia bacterium]|nr:hypothetical protein [Terriglobia bacterium]
MARTLLSARTADSLLTRGRECPRYTNQSGDDQIQSAVLYSQAVRHASQYIRPSVQSRTSVCDWQKTQNFSHQHLASGCSHWAQTIRLRPGLDDMIEV